MASGSGWNLWVWLAGGVYIYRFPLTTYPYSSCIYLLFLQQHNNSIIYVICNFI